MFGGFALKMNILYRHGHTETDRQTYELLKLLQTSNQPVEPSDCVDTDVM